MLEKVTGAAQSLFGSLAVMVIMGAAAIPAAAQTVPSNLQIVGTISASDDGVAPEEGDEVLVVKGDSTEGSGTVIDSGGTYFVEMSKTQDYNGTSLSLRLRKSSGTYQLEFGPDNQFTFNGGFPFPSRTTINPAIGAKLSGGGGDGGGGGGGGSGGGGYSDSDYDVNGDGVFNQADIDLIKQAIVGGTNETAADVDGNGIVNTRDAIMAIRALTSYRHQRAPVADGSDSGDSGSDDSNQDDTTDDSTDETAAAS
jgi:hypothetical protein